MVSSALVRRLQAGGYANLLARTHAELDLTDQRAVHGFMAAQRPDYVFIAAAKVGGIQANNRFRAEFLYQNLMIEANLIHGAHLAGVQRLMFLASSCIYPRDASQRITEDSLLTGPLEQTNEPYAIAKIAGVKVGDVVVRVDPRYFRPTEVETLLGDPAMQSASWVGHRRQPWPSL